MKPSSPYFALPSWRARFRPRPSAPRVASALFAATAALTVVAACASSASHSAGGDSPQAPPASSTVKIPVGSSTHTVSASGRSRTFRVYRPANLPADAALVVVLHGASSTGQQAESSSGWDKQADQAHFLVAYPDGFQRNWAVSADCCGSAAAQHVDDVTFVATVVETIFTSVPLDHSRIFATGTSNGGILAYRLACETSLFAAIGPNSATQLDGCAEPTPTSVIHIHSTADKAIPYHGGTGSAPDSISGPAIPDVVRQWRKTDKCAAPTSTTDGNVTTSTATCPGNHAVELVTIGGPESPGLDATATIWNFFAKHGRGGA